MSKSSASPHKRAKKCFYLCRWRVIFNFFFQSLADNKNQRKCFENFFGCQGHFALSLLNQIFRPFDCQMHFKLEFRLEKYDLKMLILGVQKFAWASLVVFLTIMTITAIVCVTVTKNKTYEVKFQKIYQK